MFARMEIAARVKMHKVLVGVRGVLLRRGK
jgi:hypothetical protein